MEKAYLIQSFYVYIPIISIFDEEWKGFYFPHMKGSNELGVPMAKTVRIQFTPLTNEDEMGDVANTYISTYAYPFSFIHTTERE